MIVSSRFVHKNTVSRRRGKNHKHFLLSVFLHDLSVRQFIGIFSVLRSQRALWKAVLWTFKSLFPLFQLRKRKNRFELIHVFSFQLKQCCIELPPDLRTTLPVSRLAICSKYCAQLWLGVDNSYIEWELLFFAEWYFNCSKLKFARYFQRNEWNIFIIWFWKNSGLNREKKVNTK